MKPSPTEYRRIMAQLTEELMEEPEADQFGQVSLLDHSLKIKMLSVITRAAVADRQLADLEALEDKMQRLEAEVNEIKSLRADAFHNRRARVTD